MFKNDRYAGRVQKMIDTLALIEKSAMANPASNGDLADMLQPLSEALAAAGIPALTPVLNRWKVSGP